MWYSGVLALHHDHESIVRVCGHSLRVQTKLLTSYERIRLRTTENENFDSSNIDCSEYDSVRITSFSIVSFFGTEDLDFSSIRRPRTPG